MIIQHIQGTNYKVLDLNKSETIFTGNLEECRAYVKENNNPTKQ